MDAMIFAAGLGTRLRPLTDTIPKALVDVGGVTMLERTARRLIAAGADRLIINVHHHADKIRAFIDKQNGFGVDVRISDETDLLRDTGGGLAHAAPHFRREEPFFLHNVDVISTVDLEAMYRAHQDSNALATLAVMPKDSSRYLLFDSGNRFRGYGNQREGTEHRIGAPSDELVRIGFCGIHVISPEIFPLIATSGPHSIIYDLYAPLAEQGKAIMGYRVDDDEWIDIGRPADLEQARRIGP